MFRSLLVILLILSGCYPTSQLKGYQEIEQLYSTKLLIQLDFPQQQIDLFNEMGFDGRAKKLKSRHERHHLKLVRAFGNFRFCPIYFYYSDPESGNLYDDQLKLYDEALQLVKYRLEDDQFFIAKFTTKQFEDGLDYEELKEGLRLYNSDSSPMSLGFPDFVPMTNYGSRNYYESTIGILDKRLHIFHRKYINFQKRMAKRKNRKQENNNQDDSPFLIDK